MGLLRSKREQTRIEVLHFIFDRVLGKPKQDLSVARDSGEAVETGDWAPDNFHLAFFETRASRASDAYIVGADGSGLRQLPPMGTTPIEWMIWSADQKSIFVSYSVPGGSRDDIWKWSVDGSNAMKYVDHCAFVTDAGPSGCSVS